MSPSPSRLAPLAVVTALALAGIATPAAAATRRPADTAAPVISAITVHPSPVVLSTRKGGRTSFKVAVRASDTGVGVDRVTLGLYDPSDSSGRAFRLSRTGGSAVEGVWTGLVSLPNNVKTGTWAVRAFATDEASNTTNPDAVYTNFRVLQKTRLHKLGLKVDPTTGALAATALLDGSARARGGSPSPAATSGCSSRRRARARSRRSPRGPPTPAATSPSTRSRFASPAPGA